MSIELLITSLIVIVSPGTGALFTLAACLARGSHASVVAAFGCTVGIVPISSPRVLTGMRRTFAGAFVALGAKLALSEH